MPPQQGIEAVTTGHKTGAEKDNKHHPQLVAADAGILAAYLTHALQYETLILQAGLNVSLGLVIGLTTMAKQTAGKRNLEVAMPDQFRYRLAPDFFLIGILKYSSARVISRSRASVSNFEKARAFSSSLTRFLRCAFSSL